MQNIRKIQKKWKISTVNKNHETKNIEVIHPIAKSEGEFGLACKDPDKLKYKWSHHQSGPAWYINPDMQWNLIGPFDLQVYEVKCESEKLFGISK